MLKISPDTMSAFEMAQPRVTRLASALIAEFNEAAVLEPAALLRLVRAGIAEGGELGFQSDEHVYGFLQLHFLHHRHPPRRAFGERIVAYLQHLELDPATRLSFARTLLIDPLPDIASAEKV